MPRCTILHSKPEAMPEMMTTGVNTLIAPALNYGVTGMMPAKAYFKHVNDKLVTLIEAATHNWGLAGLDRK